MIKSLFKQIIYGNQSNFYINLCLKDGLGVEFTACEVELMLEGALTSFTVCDSYRYFAGQATALLMTSQSRSCTEYLLPTDNIIVLD